MAPEPRRSVKPPDQVARSVDSAFSGKKDAVRNNKTKIPASVPAMSTNNNASNYSATPSYSTPYYGGYGGNYYSSGVYPPAYPPSYPMNSSASTDPISWIYSLSYTMSSLSQFVQVLSCHSNSIYFMVTSTITALNRIADAIRNEGELQYCIMIILTVNLQF